MNRKESSTFSAKKVTNTFFDFYADYDIVERISNIVAQKLNYIANGYWIVLKGNRLIEEDFEAWHFGPVIPELYQNLKHFGRNHIDYIYPLSEDWEELEEMVMIERIEDQSIKDFINFIFQSFKEHTVGELIDFTHKENGAWHETFTKSGQSEIIKDDLIKKEFQKYI